MLEKRRILVEARTGGSGGLGNLFCQLRFAFFSGLVLDRRIQLVYDDDTGLDSIITTNLYDWKGKGTISSTPPTRYFLRCSDLANGNAYNMTERIIRITTHHDSDGTRCDFSRLFLSMRVEGKLSSEKYSTLSKLASTSNCFFQYFFRLKEPVYRMLPVKYVKSQQKISLHLRWGDVHFFDRLGGVLSF